MNMYGPTETSVWSTSATIGPHDRRVSIGKPIANTSVYVLDRNRQPRPIGVSGELYIGGDGTTRGYWNRPELSADRFLPDPYRGGRMYRTGDLVRWRDDGALEFLGRIDHQVKIRGHRIELGEIERAIAESVTVREVVVVAREDVPGDKRLVAYVVPRAAAERVDVAALQRRLRARLPDVMVPAHFVTLSSFPLTPNGKLDRKSLPPVTTLMTAAPPAQAELPAGEIEELIAGIWRDVLQLQEVGTQDNFFDLGGHSLLAVQAHRRLKKAFDQSISLTDLFRFPTIRSLAQFLSGGGTEQHTRAAVADRADMRRRSVAMRTRRLHAGRAVGNPDSVEQDA
jgi:acyl carrier protein